MEQMEMMRVAGGSKAGAKRTNNVALVFTRSQDSFQYPTFSAHPEAPMSGL